MSDFSDLFTHARIEFVERRPVEAGNEYHRAGPQTPDGRMHTVLVPRVGESIWFRGVGYRVLAVQWAPPSLGSQDWPFPTGIRDKGIMVTVLVEAADVGLYVDEVVRPDPEDS